MGCLREADDHLAHGELASLLQEAMEQEREIQQQVQEVREGGREGEREGGRERGREKEGERLSDTDRSKCVLAVTEPHSAAHFRSLTTIFYVLAAYLLCLYVV